MPSSTGDPADRSRPPTATVASRFRASNIPDGKGGEYARVSHLDPLIMCTQASVVWTCSPRAQTANARIHTLEQGVCCIVCGIARNKDAVCLSFEHLCPCYRPLLLDIMRFPLFSTLEKKGSQVWFANTVVQLSHCVEQSSDSQTHISCYVD